MFLRSISFIFLLFVGCGVKIATLHIPYGLQKPPPKLYLTFTSKLKTPWQIGIIKGKKEPLTIDNDITKCVRSFFLQKLPVPHEAVQIRIVLKDFNVVVRKAKAYGYAKFTFSAQWRTGVAQKEIVVQGVAKIEDQEDLEALVVGMCKEAAKIMKEQYALLAL